jgi:hypothetical protein
MEETLVAELMLSPGLDATMVGPLERIEADDTDYLCLSSFQYNFALVSTLDASSAQKAWDRLGLSGTIVDLGIADGVDASPVNTESIEGKRILYLRLSPNARVTDVVTQLQNLLAARNVKPVSIGCLAKTTAPKHKQSSEPVVGKSKPTNQAPASVAPQQPHQSRVVPTSEVDEDDEEWTHLDRLVDDLDDLDL